MLRTKYLTLAGCAVAALAFTGTLPAFAASSMCVDGMMVSSDDAMMADEHMGDDAMMGDEAMSDDSMMADGEMAHDEAMGDEAMSDDSMMSDEAMSDDGMMAEDSMSEDSMMAEGETAHDDAMGADAMMTHEDMMGEYTVMVGDSLYAIAEAQLCDGDRYPELIAANADILAGATMLQPGMVLTIPGD